MFVAADYVLGIFSDNDNLPISCKNAEISAVDNFFDNIAHPYFHTTQRGILLQIPDTEGILLP